MQRISNSQLSHRSPDVGNKEVQSTSDRQGRREVAEMGRRSLYVLIKTSRDEKYSHPGNKQKLFKANKQQRKENDRTLYRKIQTMGQAQQFISSTL